MGLTFEKDLSFIYIFEMEGSELDKNEVSGLWSTESQAYQDYFMSQYDTPKESTKQFEQFIQSRLERSTNILDIGGGNGSATHYLANIHRHCTFTCADYSPSLVRAGASICKKRGISNVRFESMDWYNIPEQKNHFDGVVSLQTLSWLEGFEKPLEQLFVKLKPRWIALSSLFYEGEISTKCQVYLHKLSEQCFYNTYSLPAVARFSSKFGYELGSVKNFELGFDLDEPTNKDKMGTYTKRVFDKKMESSETIQISGPVLLNWKFIVLQRVL